MDHLSDSLRGTAPAIGQGVRGVRACWFHSQARMLAVGSRRRADRPKGVAYVYVRDRGHFSRASGAQSVGHAFWSALLAAHNLNRFECILFDDFPCGPHIVEAVL